MSERYRLEALVATGGMGEVWRATDTVLGREVALKLLRSEYAGDPAFRSRFETEARNAAALHHPNVASVFDFGELPASDGGAPRAYLVMELVRGEPLSALLRHGERMPAATACDLLAQAADALAAAHDLGIVHRDVKPANLLVTPDGTVKITDFGIARAANAAALTQTGQVVGTPQYLSPEQAEGRPATAASDIYSLGVVLYECLAGRRPFDGDSPIATALAHLRQEPPPLPDDVPAEMRETVRIALTKDPAGRFATARSFAAVLRGGPLPVGGATTVVAAAEPATSDDTATRVAGSGLGAGLGGAALAAGAGGVAAGAVGAAPAGRTAAEVGDGDPPVLAPPPDEDEDEGRRRRPGWLPWVVAAAALLLLGALLLPRLLGDDTDPAGTTTAAGSRSGTAAPSPARSSAATPAAADVVTVDEAAYLGRPQDEVEQALERLGLEVDEEQVANPGSEEADTVAGVSPSGEVEVGSTVTLGYYDDPPPAPTATATATPTPTPTPTEPPDDQGDGDDEGDEGDPGGGEQGADPDGDQGGSNGGAGNGNGNDNEPAAARQSSADAGNGQQDKGKSDEKPPKGKGGGGE